MAKISDIKFFYRFNPELQTWTTDSLGKSYWHKLYCQTYDGGDFFCSGVFFFIRLTKLKSLHMHFTWWQFRIPKRYDS